MKERLPQIIGATFLFGAATVLLTACSMDHMPVRIDLAVFGVLSVLAVIAFMVFRKKRLKIVAATISTVFALYLAEFCLLLVDPGVASPGRNVPNADSRHPVKILTDLRREGKRAWASFGLAVQRRESNGESDLISLGGISNSWTLLGNESGQHPVYLSDEYGFNNPAGWSSRTDLRTIALVGDSFVQGACVNPEESMQAQLGQLVDAPGYQVVGLGIGGASALTELGVIIEYLKPLKPEVVYWCYYENDLLALPSEAETILIRYLNEPGFSQQLPQHQDEIDTMLIRHAENREAQFRSSAKSADSASNQWVTNLKLGRLRKLILSWNRSEEEPRRQLSKDTLDIFAATLKRADELVRQWDGKLVFVYLPSFEDCFQPNQALSDRNANALNIARELDLEILDLYEEVFKPAENAKELFPHGGPGHYNAEGYRKAAEQMFERISAAKKLSP